MGEYLTRAMGLPVVRIDPAAPRRVAQKVKSTVVRVPPEIRARGEYDRLSKELHNLYQRQRYCDEDHEVEIVCLRARISSVVLRLDSYGHNRNR